MNIFRAETLKIGKKTRQTEGFPSACIESERLHIRKLFVQSYAFSFCGRYSP